MSKPLPLQGGREGAGSTASLGRRAEVGDDAPPPSGSFLRKVIAQPTPEASKAIAEFVKSGTWPKPGILPVCIRLGKPT